MVPGDLHDVVFPQPAVAERGAEWLTVNEFHRQKEASTVLFDRVHRGDRRMIELSRDLHLAAQARTRFGIDRDVRREDRDVPQQARILSDVCNPAASISGNTSE